MDLIQFQNKRVGSTFLQKAIDSHPDIVGIDEVFVNMAKKPGMRKSGIVPYLKSGAKCPEHYIEKFVWGKYPDKHTIIKLMYNQINYHQRLLEFIKRRKIPMIHLMRKNLVKQVISGMTADNTKHNHITITPEQMMDKVVEADNLNNYWAKQLKDHIKLTLYYEDIIGERGYEGSKYPRTYVAHDANVDICKLFNVRSFLLHTNTKKKNKEDISVYLPNINKIKKMFKGSKYEWMI
jgi:hypothetical protein